MAGARATRWSVSLSILGCLRRGRIHDGCRRGYLTLVGLTMLGLDLTRGRSASAFRLTSWLLVLALQPAAGQIRVDGNWSPWSTLSSYCVQPTNRQALVSCGGGVMTKYRSCTNPAPQNGGANCSGVDRIDQACNVNPCPLDAAFMWSEWTECSNRCGRGQQRRYMMCGDLRQRLPALLPSQVAPAIRPTVAPSTLPPVSGATTAATSPLPATSAGSSVTAPPPSAGWIGFWELSLSTPCVTQPPLQVNVTVRDCNTWYYLPQYPNLWNASWCVDPCLVHKCPKFSKCDTLLSTTQDPVVRCTCQMGTVMKSDNSSCLVPPPTTPTPRPVPTLPAVTKAVTSAISQTASTVIIIFLSLTLLIFLIFRIFDTLRVIQMMEEVTLLAAHCCMLPTLQAGPDQPIPTPCKIVSICKHFFFTSCFTFMFLESLHIYAMVASVVKERGMMSRKQNVLIGLGLPAFVVLFNMCFEYDNYGGLYHCWLQMDTGLLYGNYVPIVILVVVTFTLIEAAGAGSEYARLKDFNASERLTSQISQSTLIIILPLLFASFVTGTTAEYEQAVSLYGSFTILNGVLGGCMFFFHISAHAKTRELFNKVKSMCCGKKK